MRNAAATRRQRTANGTRRAEYVRLGSSLSGSRLVRVPDHVGRLRRPRAARPAWPVHGTHHCGLRDCYTTADGTDGSATQGYHGARSRRAVRAQHADPGSRFCSRHRGDSHQTDAQQDCRQNCACESAGCHKGWRRDGRKTAGDRGSALPDAEQERSGSAQLPDQDQQQNRGAWIQRRIR